MHCVALICTHIKTRVGGQHALGNVQRLVSTQYGTGETAALHLRQLVYQHIARGPDLAFEAEAAAQQKRLAESATIGELREMQVNAGDARKRLLARVRIIGERDKLRVICAVGAGFNGARCY